MYAAKTIDELYEEVKDYDYVICNDAPLTTALNNRLDKAQLGPFAITPLQFASWKAVEFFSKPIIDDIRLVKNVSKDTGFSIRYVHGEVERFRAALRFTSDPRMGAKSREVWRYFNRYNTLESILRNIDSAAAEFFRYSKVAVVGVEFFDELDKHIIPPNADFIDIFDPDRDFSISQVRILGNDRQIAECAADIAKRCGPNDVAIVMDTGGDIANAVKSALYREELPFINNLNVKDIGSVRNYLEFIQLALSYSTVMVKDVRQLISAYGGWIAAKYDNYYLSKFRESNVDRSERTDELLEIMSTVRDYTFEQACVRCVPSKDRSSVSMLLDQMDADREPVSQSILDDLTYAVNSIPDLKHNEQLIDDEKKGVLLVDCKNSVYIDRPVIVYTGMCSEWAVDLGNIDYIDPKKIPDIEERYALRFKALIQQGSVRFYFVNATKEGKEAVPCRYFDECIRLGVGEYRDDPEGAKPIDSFGQVCTGEPIEGTWKIDKKDRSSHEAIASLETQSLPDSLSNSSYMKFLECPRQYMYSKLSGGPDSSTTYTGEKIHDYAEFRVSYPDLAKENGYQYYADMISDECASLNSPDLNDIERSRITAAVRAVDMFIEGLNIEPGRMVERSRSKKDRNMFLEHHGLEMVSEHTEKAFASRDLAMNGVMDLVWNGIIYDYKTGKTKTSKQLAKEFDITDILSGERTKDHKSCQALFYMCLLEEEGGEYKDRFDLFYAQAMYDQLLAGGQPDPEGCRRTIVIAESMEEALGVHLRDFFSSVKAYQDIVPLDLYRICSDLYGNDMGTWPVRYEQARPVAERLGLKGARGDITKGNTETAAGAVKKMVKALSQQYIEAPNSTLIVLRQSVDEFKDRVREDLKKLREYYVSDFPAQPTIYCKDCDFRDACTAEPEYGGDEDE